MAEVNKNLGRPLKFQSVKDLQKKIDNYFKECDPHFKVVTEWVEARDSSGSLKKDKNGLNYYVKVTHRIKTEQVHYTISGLALALDSDRHTLLDYEMGKHYGEQMTEEQQADFSTTIKRAKEKIAAYVEQQLHTTTPTGAIFNLKANYGWRDNNDIIPVPTGQPMQWFSAVPLGPPEPEKESA